jgi:putative transcriptional regulator
MAIVRFSLEQARQVKFTAEEAAALDAMTPEEIEANALSDPDNPPMTEDELARGVAGRFVRLTREATGLSRAGFAARYRLDPAKLDDWEDGRVLPDPMALSYLRVIAREREAVNRALDAAE